MADLLTELESAAEGLPEFDAQIHAKVLGGVLFGRAGGGWTISIDGEHHGVADRAIPPYTTSLDAALSLVPEGWRWGRDQSGFVFLIQESWPESQRGPIIIGGGNEATPVALALCIAALKARQTKASNNCEP